MKSLNLTPSEFPTGERKGKSGSPPLVVLVRSTRSTKATRANTREEAPLEAEAELPRWKSLQTQPHKQSLALAQPTIHRRARARNERASPNKAPWLRDGPLLFLPTDSDSSREREQHANMKTNTKRTERERSARFDRDERLFLRSDHSPSLQSFPRSPCSPRPPSRRSRPCHRSCKPASEPASQHRRQQASKHRRSRESEVTRKEHGARSETGSKDKSKSSAALGKLSLCVCRQRPPLFGRRQCAS